MWTLPNMLTMARVAAAPGVLLVFAVLDRPLADAVAFGLFVTAALTDFLDGWLARRLGQESALGRMLDPIADKAMVILALAAVLVLHSGGAVDWAVALPAATIMLREVLVSGLREFLGDVKLAVTQLAKWKTTAQMVALGVLLAAGVVDGADTVSSGETEANRAGGALVAPIGILLLWIAAGLTVATGWDYFRKGLAHIGKREEG
ncbi:MAG: CDP-diacylglycerol--glycerol-3-phosphate 3-phosphatidyltransferase [Pseudomonadota bacterium]